jgi:hypothetical protein
VVAISGELWSRVIAKGRELERGSTNGLLGPEIADIMDRFSDAGFQIQVYRDLVVARYKLYDATGIWLQSRPYVSDAIYGEIESAGQAYLDESLAPAYFRRLRQEPYAPAPRLKPKRANFVTRNFLTLPPNEQLLALTEFLRVSLRNDDWFYALRDGSVFAVENETGSYTLMLAEDY